MNKRFFLNCFVSTHEGMVIDPPYSTPLKQSSVPKLRYVSIDLFVGVAWLLSYFEDLQRFSQFEQLNISGHVRFTFNSSFPRVTALKQWLLLNKSKLFTFQMKMSADWVQGAEEVQDNVFAEYRQATGDDSAAKYLNIHIRYPEMSFSYPIAMNDEHRNNTENTNEVIDENIEEVKDLSLLKK